MPTGKPKCPVCKGKGTLTENPQEYEFVSRDPMTSKCRICNGTGWLNPSTKLPNGKRAFEVFRKTENVQEEPAKRLNVSKKASPQAVNAYGDVCNPNEDKSESGREPYEAPLFVEMALNPRLNKVLASGKQFLIVTETEPYYLDVYRMIRYQEQTQGTWTAQDEQGYVEALEDRIKELVRRNDGKMCTKEVSNG